MPDLADVLMASRYRLEDQIAVGGFGEVWRATDVVLERPVAIKLLRPTCTTDPMTLARFRVEARHAASLSHANIAAVYDFCEPPPPGTPFLVMEYVAGTSLAALLADGPMSPASAMDVVADTAAGLAAAHRAGLVHRDIKPSNLLLNGEGRVKITDFGISHAAGSDPLTVTGVLIGTPAYMAPERVGGEGGSPASDIYSLGIVAYHAVTGAIPFTGNPVEVAMAHRERPLPPMPAFVPSQVAAFITRLTAKDPAARPADASEVAQWASELCDQLTAGAVSRRRIRAAHRRRIRPSYPVPTQAEYLAPRGAGRPAPLGAGQPAALMEAGQPAPMEAVQPAPMGGMQPALTGAPLPARTRRHRARTPATPGRLYQRAGIAAAAVAMTVLGLYLANVHTPNTPYAADALPRISGPARSNPPRVAAAHLIDVKASSLVGQQVWVAVRKLRALGLSAVVSWQPAGSETPGTVISVRPAGQVAAGSRIELVAAYHPASSKSAAPSPSGTPSGGQTHHHGHGPKKPKPKDSNQPSPSDSQSPSPSSSPSQPDGGGNGDASGGGHGGNGNGGQVSSDAYAVGG